MATKTVGTSSAGRCTTNGYISGELIFRDWSNVSSNAYYLGCYGFNTSLSDLVGITSWNGNPFITGAVLSGRTGADPFRTTGPFQIGISSKTPSAISSNNSSGCNTYINSYARPLLSTYASLNSGWTSNTPYSFDLLSLFQQTNLDLDPTIAPWYIYIGCSAAVNGYSDNWGYYTSRFQTGANLTFTYTNTGIYYYKNSAWNMTKPYIYINNGWQEATGSYFDGTEWKNLSV